jgi:cytochrome b561
MEILVTIAFIAIIASLGFALFFMMKDGSDGKPKTSRMAKALAFRIGISVVLFLCILISWKLGYIQPTGIQVGQ